MELRKLGWTDLELSVIGLGTWAIGGPGWEFAWGAQDDQDSIRAIRTAIDSGVNWIDTAHAYGLGHSEEVIGRALKEMPQQPIVATKCGRLGDAQGNLYGCLKADSVRKECEGSLRRLDIDVIDLYQVHWPAPEEDLEEAWEEIARMVDEGKIRYAGVSNFQVAHMERIRSIMRPASLQPPYSMLRRDIEEEILPYCAENEIGVVVYSPMQKGLLTGAFDKQRAEDLPASDHRSRDKMFHEPRLSINLDLVDGLRKVADDLGCTVAQLAVAWTLRRPEVTAAIVGARNPKQAVANAEAGEVRLSDRHLEEMEKLLAERNQALENL